MTTGQEKCAACGGRRVESFNRHGTLQACGRCRGSGFEPTPCPCGCGLLFCRNCNAACAKECTCPDWLVREERWWATAG